MPEADDPTSAPRRPLAGVRVLEFAHVASGPFAGMLLADLGADVVKMEGPSGDQMREWPPIAETGGEPFSHNFASLNRSKRSVRVDLKSPEGMEVAERLVSVADVVLENYRPGVLTRLGLGYEQVAEGHPGLVYASVSGFGQAGPYAGLGAYDVVIQGMSGLMSVTGQPDALAKAGVPVADFISGLYAALSIVSWLPVVRLSGTSVHLDVPMLDCLLATSALQTSEFWGTGRDPVPLGTRHPRNAPYQVFHASDGPFVLAAGNDVLWRRVAAVVGREPLCEDPRFVHQADRVVNQEELARILDACFSAAPAQSWISRLREVGVPCGPVNTFSAVLEDPVLRSSGFIQPLDLPDGGTTWTTVFPVRSSQGPPPEPQRPPRLGEHTTDVIAEWLRDDGQRPAPRGCP